MSASGGWETGEIERHDEFDEDDADALGPVGPLESSTSHEGEEDGEAEGVVLCAESHEA